MSENTTYKITIEGAGLSLDRQISKKIGEQVIVLLLTGDAPSSPPPITAQASGQTQHEPTPPSHSAPHTGATPETSIREFIISCEAKRIPDKIAAIGTYLYKHSKQPNFDKDDLISNFESAAEPVPKNITRDLKWTLKAGWIALKNGSKDCYYVTNSGKTAVEQKFSKEVVKKTRGLMPGGTKKPSKSQDNQD